MNKYELVKSIILTILVLASGFFTWSLWTYQSNYEPMEKTNYIKEVLISKKQDIAQIIKPNKVIYHRGEEHFGTDEREEMEKIIQHLAAWDFYNVQDITTTIGEEEFFTFVHGKGTIELIFPTLIPVEQYKSVLPFEEKKLPSFEFDRIVIHIEDHDKEDGKIYFVSYETRSIYASNVQSALIDELANNFYKPSNNHPKYFSYDTGNRQLFILEEPPVFSRNKYFLNLLNVDLFRDALFVNPSVVQKTFLTAEDEYTDSSSMMTANYSTRLLSYVNPVEETDTIFNRSDILQRSIDFMNEHSGWSDEYHFVEAGGQKTVFRLYVDGKPVFNESGMSEIVQIWGENKVYKYIRPYFTLDVLLTPETSEMTLPTGETIMTYLEKEDGFNPELLDELVPAYKMIKDKDEPRLIILEPTWYYRYNNIWDRITMDDLGGLANGLE